MRAPPGNRRILKPAKVRRSQGSPAEFAASTGVSRATTWRMMKRGALRYVRVGKLRRIPISEFARYGATLEIE
jgi:excisionase family DNA binding protein